MIFMTFGTQRQLCSQSSNDELIRKVKNAAEDTAKVKYLNKLSFQLLFTNPDTSFILAKQALQLADKIRFELGKAEALIAEGQCHWVTGNYPRSLQLCFEALNLLERLEKNTGKADSIMIRSILRCKSNTYGSIANSYVSLGNYPKTLEYYFMGVKVDEKLGNFDGLAKHYCNIGNLYAEQNNEVKAMEYYMKGLGIAENIKNSSTISRILVNVGMTHEQNREFDKAASVYDKALKLALEIKDNQNQATLYGNLGVVYQEQQLYDKALEQHLKSLNIAQQFGYKETEANALGNIGYVYGHTARPKEAYEYYSRALNVCKEIGYLDAIRDFERSLYQCDSASGNYQNACEHYKKYVQANDSLKNEDDIRRLTQLEMQFDFDKKQAADSVKVAEEKKVAAAELRAERNKSYSLYGGLGLVLVFAGFMYNRFRITQRQKKVIEEQKLIVEHQKKIVEEKNKEVMDSIYYARRIQRSLLPTNKYLEKKLRN
jgi:tetratricopeptide (TPR) repeat protein